MKETIKQYTPEFIKNIYRSYKLNKQLKAYKGKDVYCPLCQSYFSKFAPFGKPERKNARCPKCNSLERERLMFLFLANTIRFFSDKTNQRLLHFAPERSFYITFGKYKNIDYTPCDLFPEGFPDFTSPKLKKVDITNIPFNNETFDFIMCNHVLEHILDDRLAMRELLRVMKKGACGIFQVPLDYQREKTYEDQSITSEEEREKAFGQKDHVRWYGRDYKNRLEDSGFKVTQYVCNENFSEEEIIKFGLMSSEIVYFCQKE